MGLFLYDGASVMKELVKVRNNNPGLMCRILCRKNSNLVYFRQMVIFIPPENAKVFRRFQGI